jgi:hypothetical protein
VEGEIAMTNQELEQQFRGDLAAFTRRADLWSLGTKVENYIEWAAAELKRRKMLRQRIQADLEREGHSTDGARAVAGLVDRPLREAEDEARDLHGRLVAVLHAVQAKIAELRSDDGSA